jgi:hypothetical protein
MGWIQSLTHSLATGLVVVSGSLVIAVDMILIWVPAKLVDH